MLFFTQNLSAQCPSTGCTTTITGSDSGFYFLDAGEKICLAPGAEFTGLIILRGGEIENCATLPQDFGISFHSSFQGNKIINNGTMILGNSWNLDRTSTFDNYGTLTLANVLGVRRNSVFNNYGVSDVSGLSVGGNGVYHNYGEINGTSGSVIQGDGHLEMHLGSTFNGVNLLVENTLLNSGEIIVNDRTTLRSSAVWTNDGGCLTTKDLLVAGKINGLVCGTITASELTTLNQSSAELTGNLAVVDLTPPASAPFVDNNGGTIASSVTWASCGCVVPVAPTWTTPVGSLDENYECDSDAGCATVNPSFFTEQQYAWAFNIQNTSPTVVDPWEVQITNANYQIDPTQLSNQSAFTYSEIVNGDGTFDLVFTGTSPLPGNGQIPGGQIGLSGINFGFTPTSDGISIYCQPSLPVADSGIVTEVSDVVTIFNSENDYTRVITYVATATNGDTSIPFTKTITVLDTTAPTASNPNNATVYCMSDIPVDILAVTNESDNCSGALTVAHIGDVSNGGTNPETITRTYRVTDLAGNFTEVTQTITVLDFIIYSQPSDVVTNAGTGVNFSVASNVNSYQWQVSTDNGITFNNVVDGAEYSGSQNQNLNLNGSAVDLSKNGFIYRAVISDASASCSITSDNATLTVNGSGSIITNRRITYRVKN